MKNLSQTRPLKRQISAEALLSISSSESCVVEMKTESASFHRYVDIGTLIYTHIYTKMCIYINFIYSLFFPKKEVNYTVTDNKY